MIYGHGDDIYLGIGKIKANFSSNVYYGGPDPALSTFLRENVGNISNYPEPNADSFRELLASFYHLDQDNFLVTNGTAEAIYLICQNYQNTSANIFIPTFSEYEDAAKLHNIECSFSDIGSLEKIPLLSGKLVFLCNPNNPTGHWIDKNTIEKLLTKNPDTIFVIDEAYADFTEQPWSATELIAHYQNIIVLKSLTKLFCIPGLRIGYIIASKQITGQITTYKIPWSVNSLALTAGSFIIGNYNALLPNIPELLNETKFLADKINKETCFSAQPSDTNFFLVRHDTPVSKELKHFLLTEYSCLIRDASNFRGLDERFFRIATQSRKDNQLLLEGLKSWSQH